VVRAEAPPHRYHRPPALMLGMVWYMVYYIPMRGRGIEETAAVRVGAPPRRYHKTKIKATLG
jgi:hypothetical protein